MAAPAIRPVSKAPPNILTPSNSIANKSIAPSPSQAPTTIHTQKQWVVPPRPKPGRKPALDAPPTKRKAQNREAQRAFRQRRAAKVGELEEQMKLMEDEDTREQTMLKVRIVSLERDLEECSRSVAEWRTRCEMVEKEWRQEQQERSRLELEVQLLKQSMSSSTEAVKLPPRNSTRKSNLQTQQTDESQDKSAQSTGCGRCSIETRCQCIEDAFELNNLSGDSSTNFKRSRSPLDPEDNGKRQRQDEEPTEIDFTTMKPPSLPKNSSTSSSSLPNVTSAPDSCGFCQAGTPCICAEFYRQEEQLQQQCLSQTAETQQLTTPPQEPVFPVKSLSKTCTNNPGTCAQCLSDPRSNLFCKSLAATRASNSPPTRPSTRYSTGANRNTSNDTISPMGETVSCAAAFTRLSSHPAFPQASVELGSWVPQLATRSIPTTSSNEESLTPATVSRSGAPSVEVGGRTAFEIEAASVMGVLKFFDRRFGQGESASGEKDKR